MGYHVAFEWLDGVDKELHYAAWKQDSCDDGPGVRSVLFLQGCSKGCLGCHNAKTHDAGAGYSASVSELVHQAEEICENKRITISGGEPLEQMEGLHNLIAALKSDGFEVCIYTGWFIEQVPASLLDMIDYIKAGPYIATLRDTTLQYVGSSNQRMYRCVRGNLTEIPLGNPSNTVICA